MSSIEEVKQGIRDRIEWVPSTRYKSGGQTVGLIDSTKTLKSEDLCFQVSIGYSRNQHINAEMCKTLFELVLDEFVK